jgi:hypothetical protein
MTTSTTQQCDDEVVLSSPTSSVPSHATTTVPHPRLVPPHATMTTMWPHPCDVLTHLIPLHATAAAAPCPSLHTGRRWCLAFALLSPTSCPSCDLASPVLAVLAVLSISKLLLPLPSCPPRSHRSESPSPLPAHPHPHPLVLVSGDGGTTA